MTSRDKKIIGGLGLLAALAFMMGMGRAEPPPEEPEEPEDEDDDDDEVPPRPGDYVGPEEPEEPDIVVVPATPRIDPVKIVNKYFGSGNRTGSLYQIQKGDNPTDVAKAALRVGGRHGAIVPYVQAMAASLVNFGLYSVIWSPVPDSQAGPGQLGYAGAGDSREKVTRRYTAKMYDPDTGKLVRWYIGDAFFPHHRRVLGMLRAGQDPQRTTDKYGVVYGSRGQFGLIWLPKARVLNKEPWLVVESLDPPADLQSLMPNIYGESE